jgi:CubicO group peptidase (beta-lactamase class C family)
MKKRLRPNDCESITIPSFGFFNRRIFCSSILGSLASSFLCRDLLAAPSSEELETSLEQLRAKHKLPGLIAGHFTLAGDQDLGAVGLRRFGSEQRLRVDDPMHLGSCTKSMTATLFGLLADEGKIKFDTTLGEVFRDDPKVTGSAWKDATMLQFICHTSGAEPNPPWNQFAGPIEDSLAIRHDILHWLVGRPRDEKSVGTFTYSNLGYAVLGHAIEKIRGHAWEQEIQQRLFEPLGMKSAGFGPPSKQVADAPWGHQIVDDRTIATEGDNPPSLGPAGTIHASMGDWIKYLRVHLMTDPKKECGLPLTSKTLKQLQRPAKGSEYAGGWVCGERTWAAGRILMHNGSNTYWYCVVFLAPRQRRGILAASNLGLSAEKPCDEALQLMLRRHPKSG